MDCGYLGLDLGTSANTSFFIFNYLNHETDFLLSKIKVCRLLYLCLLCVFHNYSVSGKSLVISWSTVAGLLKQMCLFTQGYVELNALFQIVVHFVFVQIVTPVSWFFPFMISFKRCHTETHILDCVSTNKSQMNEVHLLKRSIGDRQMDVKRNAVFFFSVVVLDFISVCKTSTTSYLFLQTIHLKEKWLKVNQDKWSLFWWYQCSGKDNKNILGVPSLYLWILWYLEK